MFGNTGDHKVSKGDHVETTRETMWETVRAEDHTEETILEIVRETTWEARTQDNRRPRATDSGTTQAPTGDRNKK